MEKIKYLIFRYLTSADYFNIYKPSGTEEKGGGQAYIDFPTSFISVDTWGTFFDGVPSVVCSTAQKGPAWTFPINSIGVGGEQTVKIYQRRPQSVCIASQRITSREENRVKAWHPDNGFPAPQDATQRDTVPANLVIYLVRTANDEFFAGWFRDQDPCADEVRPILKDMLNNTSGEGYAGFIDVGGRVAVDAGNPLRPFSSP